MPSKKISAMPDLAGAQVGADEITALDVSEVDPALRNVRSTLTALFGNVPVVLIVNANSANALRVRSSALAAIPVLDVDTSVGAQATGLIVQGQAAADAVLLLAASSGADEAIAIIPKGTESVVIGNAFESATPSSRILEAVRALGNNIAGVNFVIAPGRATGNAVPGIPAFRYPLIGASGAVLQSLSTNNFGPSSLMFLHNNGDITVTNTTTETELIGAGNFGSKIIEAGLNRISRVFYVRLLGRLATTGIDSIRFRFRLGGIAGTVIADTGSVPIALTILATNGELSLECFFSFRSTGAAASVNCSSLRCDFPDNIGGATNGNLIRRISGSGVVNVNGTAAQQITISAQWSAASAGNSLVITSAEIYMSA